MAKEQPRYKASEQYEQEFKKEYSAHIGSALIEVVKALRNMSNVTEHDPNTAAGKDHQ